MLRHLGAATTLRAPAAATLLEDERVGFAYVSQREVQPSAYSLNDMRLHIKKRPPFATTEKVQRFVQVRGFASLGASVVSEGGGSRACSSNFEEKLTGSVGRLSSHYTSQLVQKWPAFAATEKVLRADEGICSLAGSFTSKDFCTSWWAIDSLESRVPSVD